VVWLLVATDSCNVAARRHRGRRSGSGGAVAADSRGGNGRVGDDGAGGRRAAVQQSSTVDESSGWPPIRCRRLCRSRWSDRGRGFSGNREIDGSAAADFGWSPCAGAGGDGRRDHLVGYAKSAPETHKIKRTQVNRSFAYV